MDEIEKHIEKITTPIFIKAIIEGQKRDNRSLEEWL